MNSEHTNRGATAVQEAEPPAPKPGRPAGHYWVAILAALTVAALIVSGILPRIQASKNLRRETQEMAVPTVTVVQPRRSTTAPEIVLPANVQAFIDSPVYARTNGYLKQWYVDIGARVKAGQLLAEIDTPEVNQQLRQARADLNTAEANLNLSRITTERYNDLLKTDSVSKQDADNAAGDYAAKQAIVHSAEANVKRLEELQSFQKIYAPFTGVITARNTELFHIAQPDKLRVYVNVPEAYSQAAKPGLTADLTLAEFPDRRFPGKLVRTANAIDTNTRTLLVEIDVDNPTGTLLSGAYAEVHLKLPGAPSSLILPVNALLFRSEGLRVATVPDGQHAELKPVTLGHDFGNEVEVVSGLSGDETVIVSPPDSIVSGQTVRIVQTPASGAPQ